MVCLNLEILKLYCCFKYGEKRKRRESVNVLEARAKRVLKCGQCVVNAGFSEYCEHNVHAKCF